MSSNNPYLTLLHQPNIHPVRLHSSSSDLQYNRIHGQPLSQTPSQQHDTVYKVISLALPYMRLQDIIELSTINSKYHAHVSSAIWSEPKFDQLSYIHDALYMFNKFLSHLPSLRPETAACIHTIRLNSIQEGLYDRVNPEFFWILVTYCRGLRSLDLGKASYFSPRSLSSKATAHWSLPRLTHINLSYCSQVNDDMLVKISRGCRQLKHVELDGLEGHKGRGLASFAAECDGLAQISVRHNVSLKDESIVALAKFTHIRLKKLDLTGCGKLTSAGFAMLARYAAHVTDLSLAQTSCSLSELQKFTCIQRRTVTLDISSMKQISHRSLAKWIWETKFECLESLTIDTATALRLVEHMESSNQLVDVTVRGLTSLKLLKLPEHVPMSFLEQTMRIFPRLTHITFVRAYFETDFMCGMYREPSPTSEAYITDASLEAFSTKHGHLTASIIKEREENIDCSLLSW